jgi:hypothetical protein
MITAHYVEIRSRRLPGEAEPTTIIREVHAENGRGRKTLKVLRGKRVLSAVTEPLSTSENTKIQRRKFVRGLYSSAERKTRKRVKRAM